MTHLDEAKLLPSEAERTHPHDSNINGWYFLSNLLSSACDLLSSDFVTCESKNVQSFLIASRVSRE